ncbi:LD-carboxypeptidase, partial [Streptococcus pluranimalium]
MSVLKPGSHLRILSPSSSIERIGGFDANLEAKETLEKLGFSLSFSEHYMEHDML